MMTLLRTRRFILLPLLFTAMALYGLFSRQAYDSAWMLRWNKVDGAQVQLIYVAICGVLVLALPFARRIRTLLRQGRVAVLVLAMAASFLSLGLLEPSQEHRLFITPFSVWIIIAHILGVSAVLVWAAVAPEQEQGRIPIFIRYAFYAVFGVLVSLHVLSLTEFMSFDLPDEPFNASIATNYAQNDDLSSQYIGSAYSSPDVVFPRYYWVMGVWLKAVNSVSLAAMRAFPVLVAGFALTVFVAGLWQTRRISGMTGTQILTAGVVLLSLSPFLRTAHNLRMDILLAAYSSLMLWGILGFWGIVRNRVKYLLLMGFALFLGMEAVPLAAVPLSTSTGMMLVLWCAARPNKWYNARYIVIYGLACAAGIGAYYLLQLLPNVDESWGRYQAFVQNYSTLTGVGGLRLPLGTLVNYIGRFNLILSPAELIVSGVAFVVVWRSKIPADRWLLGALAGGFVLLLVIFRLSYSYMVVFTPFMAYVIARTAYGAWSSRMRHVFLVVAIPALVGVPVFDLTNAMQTRPNQARLEVAEPLTVMIPKGTVIVGEDVYWFTLHEDRTYIGINGLANYVAIRGVSYLEALQTLKVDTLLCESENAACDGILATGYFGEATAITIGNTNLLLYPRENP